MGYKCRKMARTTGWVWSTRTIDLKIQNYYLATVDWLSITYCTDILAYSVQIADE